jgi:hypothetical protein
MNSYPADYWPLSSGAVQISNYLVVSIIDIQVPQEVPKTSEICFGAAKRKAILDCRVLNHDQWEPEPTLLPEKVGNSVGSDGSGCQLFRYLRLLAAVTAQ